MSDEYWKVVEPVWDKISIYDGGDTFLRQFSEATEKQQVLFAAHWAQSEIMNGGLGQFFANSTGVLAPEAAVAFEQLGMPKCANILRTSMQFFGVPYPRDRSTREQTFEAFWKEFGEEAIPLLELEDAMAVEIEQDNGGFWDAANKYAEEC
jgi:Domain of unknown function (DUF4375)